MTADGARGLAHEPDPAVGAWIRDRLGPFGATVGGLVPRGFAAYARILHRLEVPTVRPLPAGRMLPEPEDVTWRRARWADAAAAHGTVLHPRAQLWRLLRLDDPWGARSDWSAPVGTLDGEQLGALIGVLAEHTDGGPDAEVVAALWEGHGWVAGGSAVSIVTIGGGTTSVAHPPPAFPPAVMGAPRLELPHRAYLLFRGPLGAVLPWCTTGTPGRWDQTPALLWPADRSWCVATEIDLDSTVVGGSRELVNALLADPGLESFEVGEGDSLMADGDTVNV